MSGILERDILTWVGGSALQKFGTLVYRTAPPRRGGEGIVETVTRSGDVGVWRGADLQLHGVVANTPRIFYVNGTPFLLIESSDTNRLLQSEDFSTSWTNVRSSDTSNQHVAPDGATTADRLVEDGTASDSHYIHQEFTSAADNQVFSVFVKDVGGGRSRVMLNIGTQGSSETNFVRAWFNAADGTSGTTDDGGNGTFGSALVESYGDDWYRFTVAGAITAATDIRCTIYLADADASFSYSGDGSSYLAIWGAQCEANTQEPTSYIATTTTTVTRNGDQLNVPFYLSGANGFQVYSRFRERTVAPFSGMRVWHIGDGSDTDPRVHVTRPSTTDRYDMVHDNGTTSDDSQLDISPSWDDDIELLATFAPTGVVQIAGRKNSGSTTTATASGVVEPVGPWSAATLHVGGRGSALISTMLYHSLIATRGTNHVLDEYAALVS